MNRTEKLLSICFILTFIGIMAVTAGCTKKNISVVETPVWVVKGSAAFNDSGNRVFYGVGQVSGVKNRSLAVTTAGNRARAEIGKIFEGYTASLMRDYAASTVGGAAVSIKTPATEEQHVEQVIKTFSAVTLTGVMIIDHWTDSSDGTVYALARLDIEGFKNSLEKMKELSAEVRDFVRKNAEKAFDKLEAEEMKH